MIPQTMDPKDIELLEQVAGGTTHFRPVQDEPSDSPMWVQRVERLRRLQHQGLIRMPEPEKSDMQPGYPAGVGPCELTGDGGVVLDKFKRSSAT
jgi:hypothetical protein